MAKRSRYRAGSSAGAVTQTPRPPNVPNPAFGAPPPAMTPDIPTPKTRSTKFTRPAPPAFTADVSKTQEQLRLSNTMKNTQLNEAPSFDWGIIRSAEGAKVPLGPITDAAQTTLDAVAPSLKNAPSPQSKAITEAMVVPPPVNPSRGAMSGVSNFMMDNKMPIAIGAGGGATAVGVGSQLRETQQDYNDWEADVQRQFDEEQAALAEAEKAEAEQINQVTQAADQGFTQDQIDAMSPGSTYAWTDQVADQMKQSEIGKIDMDNYDPLRGYKQLIGYRDSGEPIYQYLSGVKGQSPDGKSLQAVLQQQRDKNVIGILDDGTKKYQKDKVAQMYYDPVFAYGEAQKNKYREDEFGNPIKSSDIMRPEGWQDIALYGTDPKKTTTKTFMGEFGPAGTPNVNIKTSIDFSSPFTTKSGKKEKNTPKLPWEI